MSYVEEQIITHVELHTYCDSHSDIIYQPVLYTVGDTYLGEFKLDPVTPTKRYNFSCLIDTPIAELFSVTDCRKSKNSRGATMLQLEVQNIYITTLIGNLHCTAIAFTPRHELRHLSFSAECSDKIYGALDFVVFDKVAKETTQYNHSVAWEDYLAGHINELFKEFTPNMDICIYKEVQDNYIQIGDRILRLAAAGPGV